MTIELHEGEKELKRVKESDITWRKENRSLLKVDGSGSPYIEEVEDSLRDHPLEDGQRWVLDRNGDGYERNPGDHEWVLVGKA